MNLSICLLVSGGLGLNILKCLLDTQYELVCVFTDNKSAEIISFCKENEMQLFIGNPRKGKGKFFLLDKVFDILLSVNYLFIIEREMISMAEKYSVNFHGSLLPKYRGRTPHVWAIINGETKTGITAHVIDEEVDNGAIIDQEIVEIKKNDTGADILNKFHELYPEMVLKVLDKIKLGILDLKEQNKNEATYFGKRNPKDGLINWQWSRERIRNWIRAQARPYPGAFTFLNKKKLVINSSEFSNIGYSYNLENGLVLAVDDNECFIKTSNGALKIYNLEYEGSMVIEKGQILGL